MGISPGGRTRFFDAGCGDGLVCSAVFSPDPDRTWRYQLRRVWDPLSPLVAFVGLNPSTADETHDDPTVRRCIGFAKRWGCGGLIMANAFAFRATDPRDMMAAADPVGPDNDLHLRSVAAEAPLVVAAWGARGVFHGRSGQLAVLLGELWALALTKGGEPRHPLYVRGDAQRVAWSGRGANASRPAGRRAGTLVSPTSTGHLG